MACIQQTCTTVGGENHQWKSVDVRGIGTMKYSCSFQSVPDSDSVWLNTALQKHDDAMKRFSADAGISIPLPSSLTFSPLYSLRCETDSGWITSLGTEPDWWSCFMDTGGGADVPTGVLKKHTNPFGVNEYDSSAMEEEAEKHHAANATIRFQDPKNKGDGAPPSKRVLCALLEGYFDKGTIKDNRDMLAFMNGTLPHAYAHMKELCDSIEAGEDDIQIGVLPSGARISKIHLLRLKSLLDLVKEGVKTYKLYS